MKWLCSHIDKKGIKPHNSHVKQTKRIWDITKYKLLIPLDKIVSSHIYKGKLQLLPNLDNLVAVFNLPKRHLYWRFRCVLPINRSWRNLVQHLQKYPSTKVNGKVEAELNSTYKVKLQLLQAGVLFHIWSDPCNKTNHLPISYIFKQIIDIRVYPKTINP